MPEHYRRMGTMRYQNGCRVNQVQQLNLELIARGLGIDIVEDLLACRDKWRAVMCDRQPTLPDLLPVDYIKLRDISDGMWNIEALFIAPADSSVDPEFFRDLATKWEANEFGIYYPPDFPYVVRMFFD